MSHEKNRRLSGGRRRSARRGRVRIGRSGARRRRNAARLPRRPAFGGLHPGGGFRLSSAGRRPAHRQPGGVGFAGEHGLVRQSPGVGRAGALPGDAAAAAVSHYLEISSSACFNASEIFEQKFSSPTRSTKPDFFITFIGCSFT